MHIFRKLNSTISLTHTSVFDGPNYDFKSGAETCFTVHSL